MQKQSVWAIVRNDIGLYLLLQRSQTINNGGQWNFPGGGVNPGETLELAVIRECLEESGMHISAMHQCLQIALPERLLTYFDVQIVDPDKVKIDHESSQFSWLTRSQALDLALHRPTKMYFDTVLGRKPLQFRQAFMRSGLVQQIYGEIDDKLVATANIVLPTRLLYDVRVQAPFRGFGYAADLMQYVMELPSAPVKVIVSADYDSRLSTQQLVRFYRQYGFEPEVKGHLCVKMQLRRK